MSLKLVIGNKNYSSWSMRPWVALRAAGIAFEEILIPLYTDAADKQRILEVYVNIAEFGDGIYGVGAASDVFFHTTPDRLGVTQAARLAAVLPNPQRFRVDAPSAYVQRRTAWITQQIGQLGGPAYLTRPAPVSGRVR